MKTFKIFFGITLLSFLTSNAQITKGNWMVGGSSSFSNKESYQHKNPNSSKLKFSEFELNANLGYFFIDNLQMGLKMGYNNYMFSSYGGQDRFSLKLGPYSRYYFLKPEKLVNLYIDGSYFFGKKSIASGEIQDNLNGFSISAGPTIFFNSSVAMELGINYSSTKFIGTNGYTENNLQFNLGFQIFLEKK